MTDRTEQAFRTAGEKRLQEERAYKAVARLIERGLLPPWGHPYDGCAACRAGNRVGQRAVDALRWGPDDGPCGDP